MNFAYLKNFMDRLTSWRIPGNSICVYRFGKEIFRYSSGYSDLENGTAMVGDELLNIYSCSKIVTVTAALQLYEQGKYLMSDPLSEYIPEFKNMYVKTNDGKSLTKAKKLITIRDLFTMTAGFNYNIKCKSILEAYKETGGKMATLDVIKRLSYEPLDFEPGTHWQYSLCHDVLAGVVEIISGQRFCEYVSKSIFERIGVDKAYYHRTENVMKMLAKQYLYVNDDVLSEKQPDQLQKADFSDEGHWKYVGKKVSYELGSEYDSGGAGLSISVPDYARFLSVLANGGIAHNGERLLSAATIDLMKTNYLTEKIRKDMNWSQLKGYSYGLGVRTLVDKVEGGSNGSIGEFGWGGAAGGTALIDTKYNVAFFYSHHMLNPQEAYYQPRLRNVFYSCIE